MHHTTERIAHISRGALVETKNSSIGPPCGIDPTTYRTVIGRSTTKLYLDLKRKCCSTFDTENEHTKPQTTRI